MTFIERHYIDNTKSPINQCNFEIYLNKIHTLACLIQNKNLSPVLFIISLLDSQELMKLLIGLTNTTPHDALSKIFTIYPTAIKSRKLLSYIHNHDTEWLKKI